MNCASLYMHTYDFFLHVHTYKHNPKHQHGANFAYCTGMNLEFLKVFIIFCSEGLSLATVHVSCTARSMECRYSCQVL